VRIGLVARFLGWPIGLGTYAVNLLLALDRLHDEHEYFIYTPAWNEVPPLSPRFRIRRSHVPRRSRAALTLWDLTLPAVAAAREPVDLLHYLHVAFPPFSPGCPVVINLLDAIPWVVPGYRLPKPYDLLEQRAVRRADLVLTLSQSAREDIERVFGLPRTKIRVIPLGGPALDPEPSSKEPYFLFVGGTERRKNLGAVLEAFSSIDGFELRVVGANTASPVHDSKREQSGVRWLGHVSEEELVELYRHASALVFPSRYEGFGLPVLEAMARRTPVIASNASSIPEVAGDAAILIDPDDVAGLRDAMRRVGADAGLREELQKRGAEVVSGFDWDVTARATVAAYEELLGTTAS
jgi:glycosyltransferase involved in cell wall biosynthesis